MKRKLNIGFLLCLLLISVSVSGQFPYFASSNATNITYSDMDGVSNDSIYIHFPASTQSNDIAILCWGHTNNISTKTIEAGWTYIDGVDDAGMDMSQHYWWKRLSGTEGGDSVLVTSDISGYNWGSITLWRGCVTTGTPYEGEGFTYASGNTHNTTSVTTTGTNRTIAAFSQSHSSAHAWRPFGSTDSDSSYAGWITLQRYTAGGGAVFVGTHEKATAGTLSSQTGGYYGDVAGTMTLAFIPDGSTGKTIQFKDYGGRAEGTALDLNIPFMGTVSADDILILVVGSEVTNTAWTTPTGWTNMGGRTSSGLSYQLYYKRATGTESGSVTLTADRTQTLHFGQMYRFAGCVTTGTPYEDLTATAFNYGSTYEANAVTSTNANSMAVNIVFHDGWLWNTMPEGYIGKASAGFTTGGGAGIQVSIKDLPTATTTSLTYGWTYSNHSSGGYTFVLIPSTAACDYGNKVNRMTITKIDGITLDCNSTVDGM